MERSGPEAQRVALNDVTTAIAAYLEACGWTSVIVDPPRIQSPPEARAFIYEVVIPFSGRRTT